MRRRPRRINPVQRLTSPAATRTKGQLPRIRRRVAAIPPRWAFGRRFHGPAKVQWRSR